ncbi:hypothetical protein BBP40_008329 [Aspergillus hancockii]|nr:hypothetical protein BBP40_008329 [Aspergillus hancockii]
MEAYFQYQRVRQAVQQHLPEPRDNCSCSSYTIGAPPNTKSSIRHDTLGKRPPTESTVSVVLIMVNWEGPNDPLNPANQSTSRKLFVTALVSLVALVVTAASAIDACGVMEYSEYFQVSEVVGSLATGWRWLEWITLIMGGTVLVLILLFQPETYGSLILCWKASILRKETGDERYRAPMEMKVESLRQRLKLSVYRPFAMFYSEPIIILVSLYLTIVYTVLFTFLEGYTYIFGETYGISQGLTSLCWAGMLVGILLVSCVVPVVYSWTAKAYALEASAIAPEIRLWYTMLGGAPAVPISLFWMGWTSDPAISIWSPLVASVLFGFGITTIFIFAYMYLIDSYDTYSASALGFLVFTRYVVAGGVTVAGGPIYRTLGVQYTLTILGSVSAAMAFVPYLLYFYGPRIRKMSKYAVNIDTE